MERRSQRIQECVESLKKQGYKVTPQRIEVIEELIKLDHPTAKQIKEGIQAKQSHPFRRISLSTIYETLEVLKEIGQINPLMETPEAAYDINEEPHPHFVCDQCGGIKDIQNGELKRQVSKLFTSSSIGAKRLEVNFYGICPACKSGKTGASR